MVARRFAHLVGRKTQSSTVYARLSWGYRAEETPLGKRDTEDAA